MSAAAATVETRLEIDLRLWRAEVERLTSASEPLAPAVRDMICAVLLSLAVDPASDRETGRDVRRMLEAVESATPTREAVGLDEPHVLELRRENEQLRALLTR